MNRDINGYVRMDDGAYWTLVEMLQKFNDAKRHTINKEESDRISREGYYEQYNGL